MHAALLAPNSAGASGSGPGTTCPDAAPGFCRYRAGSGRFGSRFLFVCRAFRRVLGLAAHSHCFFVSQRGVTQISLADRKTERAGRSRERLTSSAATFSGWWGDSARFRDRTAYGRSVRSAPAPAHGARVAFRRPPVRLRSSSIAGPTHAPALTAIHTATTCDNMPKSHPTDRSCLKAPHSNSEPAPKRARLNGRNHVFATLAATAPGVSASRKDDTPGTLRRKKPLSAEICFRRTSVPKTSRIFVLTSVMPSISPRSNA